MLLQNTLFTENYFKIHSFIISAFLDFCLCYILISTIAGQIRPNHLRLHLAQGHYC